MDIVDIDLRTKRSLPTKIRPIPISQTQLHSELMFTSRESKEAAFFHDSDLEATKIRDRCHKSPSTQFGITGSRPRNRKILEKGHNGLSSNRLVLDADGSVAHQIWTRRTRTRPGPKIDSGQIEEDGEEDVTRHWPWMSDTELAWQPPAERPEINLLEMAKPNRRKGKYRPNLIRDVFRSSINFLRLS